MRLEHLNCRFDAQDQKVYADWLQKISIAYAVLILIGIVVVAVQATKGTTNVAGFVPDVVTATAP